MDNVATQLTLIISFSLRAIVLNVDKYDPMRIINGIMNIKTLKYKTSKICF